MAQRVALNGNVGWGVLRWLDRWLQAGAAWPAPPNIELDLRMTDRVPAARVTAERAAEITGIAVHYSSGRFPSRVFGERSRFNRQQRCGRSNCR
jgi:hypothetical protein